MNLGVGAATCLSKHNSAQTVIMLKWFQQQLTNNLTDLLKISKYYLFWRVFTQLIKACLKLVALKSLKRKDFYAENPTMHLNVCYTILDRDLL